jgi:hypothetical protein
MYQQSFDYAAALLCSRVSGSRPAAKTSNSGSDVSLSSMVAAAAGCYGSMVNSHPLVTCCSLPVLRLIRPVGLDAEGVDTYVAELQAKFLACDPSTVPAPKLKPGDEDKDEEEDGGEARTESRRQDGRRSVSGNVGCL